MYYYYWKF